jgi:hypothetical protein
MGDLHDDVTNPTRSRVHQHLLSGVDLGAIYQPLPRGDEGEWKRTGFAHGKICRLDGQ